MQRIVAGEFKGRRLLALPRGQEGLRPSSSRVRGAIFDRLQSEVVGARVLDLFAGSGALAIEALSRGAAFATLVERAPALQRHLRRQLETLDLGQRSELVARDALSWLRAPAQRFDLVFLDPPYAQTELYGQSLAALVEGGWLAPEAVVVVERGQRAGIGSWPAGLVEELERRHGDCVLHFLRASAAD